MARQFFVEHYRPGLGSRGLRDLASRVAQATDELQDRGTPVRYLGATILPLDEALLCLFEAPSEEAVRAAYERAGVDFERISPSVRGPAGRRTVPSHHAPR